MRVGPKPGGNTVNARPSLPPKPTSALEERFHLAVHVAQLALVADRRGQLGTEPEPLGDRRRPAPDALLVHAVVGRVQLVRRKGPPVRPQILAALQPRRVQRADVRLARPARGPHQHPRLRSRHPLPQRRKQRPAGDLVSEADAKSTSSTFASRPNFIRFNAVPSTLAPEAGQLPQEDTVRARIASDRCRHSHSVRRASRSRPARRRRSELARRFRDVGAGPSGSAFAPPLDDAVHARVRARAEGGRRSASHFDVYRSDSRKASRYRIRGRAGA